MLLDHRCEQRRDEPGRLPRAAERTDRGDGVALVRHRRRAAGAASCTSPTSVCASKVMSRATLPIAPAATPSAPASSPIRPRKVCQGSRGLEAEVVSEGAQDGEGGVGRVARARRAARRRGNARQRPDRPAQLHRQSRAAQPGGRLVQPHHPTRGLEAEGRRLRLLEQRAADDRRVAVDFRELRRGIRGAAKVLEQRHERAFGHEHRRGVDGVLARRAVVDRRVDDGPERLDDRAGGVADLGRVRADLRHVEAVDLARRRRFPGLLLGDHVLARLGAREAGLEVQQRLQPGSAGDLLGDAAAGEHAREDVRA